MSYRVIAHSRSGEVAYRGTEVHGSYGAAEAEARVVARRAGLTDVHIVKDGKRIVGEVKAVGGARSNPGRQARPVRRWVGTQLEYIGGMGDDEYRVRFNGRVIARAFISPRGGGKFNWGIEGGGGGVAGDLHSACTRAKTEALKQMRSKRRNPDRFAAHEIEVISWPTPWHAGHYPKMSKKDFKDYVKLNGWSAEVMCHGMRSVPGSLRDLPRTRHAVYGGTSNPNRWPAKWYGTLDLTGETPKVS